jgi:hypothetical protein
MTVKRYPLTFQKACYCLWAVKQMGWSQTHTALIVQLNVGDVSKAVNGHRFPMAYAMAIPGYEAA